MDFARKQLMKYGWEEGKGLGKDENGIAKPVKATLKFDTAGLGCSRSEQFTNQWWDNVYNNASKNLKVRNENGKVKVKLNSGKSVDISTKKMTKRVEDSTYGLFLKTSELTDKGIVELPKSTAMEVDNSESDENDTKKINCGINSLTDEEIYKACGGRTAHKGARHGLKLSGKLARLEEQEMLLSGIKNVQTANNNDVKYKQLARLKKQDDRHRTPESECQLLALSESPKKVQNSNEQDLAIEMDLSNNSFETIRKKTKPSKRRKSKPNSVAANARKNKNEWILNEKSIKVYQKTQYWTVFDVDMYKIQINALKEKVLYLKNKREKFFKKVDKYNILWSSKPDDCALKIIEQKQKKYKVKYEEVCKELHACKNELKNTRRGLKVTKTRLRYDSKLENVLETMSNMSVSDDSNQS